MALEQWELDLRKQLEGTPPEQKPKEKSWEDRLREQISNIQPTATAPASPKKSGNSSVYWLMIFLVLAVAGALLYKTGVINQYVGAFGNQGSQACPEEKPKPPAHDLAGEIRRLNIDINTMKEADKLRYESITKKLKKNSDKITLLGMMHNENWSVVKAEGTSSNSFLYFNHDWTISGHPQYLELTEEDKAFLEKYRK